MSDLEVMRPEKTILTIPSGSSVKDRIKNFMVFLINDYLGNVVLMLLFILGIIFFLGSFSEPMRQVFGRPLLPIQLDENERAGRIIILYHSLAVPFLAAVVFFLLHYFEVRPRLEPLIKWSLLAGAITTPIAGMSFAYIVPQFSILLDGIFDLKWIFHGVFLVALSITFFAGVVFFFGVFPTKGFPNPDKYTNSPYFKWINIEYLNLSLLTLYILISTIIGAIVGSYFGNEFHAVLSEDIVREPHHNVLERMVISHLHIMVALLAAAVLLLVLKHSKIEGKWYDIAQYLIIPGSLIMSIGAWLVIPDFEKAHQIINVGASFLLLSAGILAIQGWKKTSRVILGENYENASITEKIMAVFKDPVKFGLFFEFLWVNLVVTIPGIYVAINLKTFRTEPYTEIERAFNTGHWHVLATLTAMIVLFLIMDSLVIPKTLKTISGWMLLAGTVIGFGFTVPYMIRTPGTSKDVFFILIDVGVSLMMIAVTLYAFVLLYLATFKRKNEHATR